MEKSKKLKELELLYEVIEDMLGQYKYDKANLDDNSDYHEAYQEKIDALQELFYKYDELLNDEYKRMEGWEI